MKLTQLDAKFVQYVDEKHHRYVKTLEEAHGVQFQCPKCAIGLKKTKTHIIGAHYILCWFRGMVPDGAFPAPGRWNPKGTDLTDLSLTPSILITGPGCGWHGYITNGNTHE